MSDKAWEPNKYNIASTTCSSSSSTFASRTNPKSSSKEATAGTARPHCTSPQAKEISEVTGDLSSPGSGDRVRNAATTTQLNYHDQTYKPDRDLEEKVRKGCERISENVHICANEPSLALYRLAEHVRKALPPTVESRSQIQRLHQQLQGVYYDAEYGLESVKSMERSSPHFKNVADLLKNALFYQQQIKHEQLKRSKKSDQSGTSMYHRLSAHLNSVDLPDLSDFKEISRETKTRVETAFNNKKNDRRSINNQEDNTGVVTVGAFEEKSAAPDPFSQQ